MPVPGLDTAVSTLSMSAALVAVGVDGPAAAAAVVANTLVNEYVPRSPVGSRRTGWSATTTSECRLRTNWRADSHGAPVLRADSGAAYLQVPMPPSTGITAPVR